MRPGAEGLSLSLVDRFFDPNDEQAIREASVTANIDAAGRLGEGPRLEAERWYTLEFRWSVDPPACRVFVDGKLAAHTTPGDREVGTASYLRLRSTAAGIDEAGFLVESVQVAAE